MNCIRYDLGFHIYLRILSHLFRFKLYYCVNAEIVFPKYYYFGNPSYLP
jgi:hypothetical protein